MDIYSILSSKPHNPHYLHKYIRFINNCQLKNVGYKGYTERHHICPKASDMFPEYKSFTQHPWNCVQLTLKQHYIAHLLLYKSYPDIRGAYLGLWRMMSSKPEKNKIPIYKNLKIKVKSGCGERMKGKTIIKTEVGYEQISCDVYSPIIHDHANKNMVVIKVGDREYTRITSEEYQNGDFQHNTKNKAVVKDVDGNTFQVDINDERYLSGELVGHTKGLRVVKDNMGQKFMSNDPNLTSIHKDMIPVKLPDGSVKKFHKDHEIIKSKKFKGQFAGTVLVRDKEGNNFRVKKDDPRYLSGELVGSQKGKITITDGIKNRRIFPNEKIPKGWQKGSCRSNKFKNK